MLLEAITVQNFLGLPDFRHPVTRRVLFIAGPNGAGKTSLQDAIRYGLTGELARGITKVGDRPMLITEGAASGFVQLQVDGYELKRTIGSGKLSGDTPEIPEAAHLCLDAPSFAALPEATRRRWLFELAGVQVNREAVAEQMKAADIAPEIIDRVLPLLRDGFPAAAAYAKEQAAQARGAWKAITGENYGSQKAASWKAEEPDNPPLIAEIEETLALVAATEQKVQALIEAKGRVAGAVSPEKKAELEATAAELGDRSAQLEAAEASLEQATGALHVLQQQARGHDGVEVACPSCATILLLEGESLRLPPQDEVPKAKLQARINGAKQSLGAAQRDVKAAKDAVRAAEVAQNTLDSLPTPSPEDLAAVGQLEDERATLALHRRTLASLEDARHRAEAAHGKTELAKAEHQKAVAWVAAEAQLGPDGIPATLLAMALDPINDALAIHAGYAGFRPARVERNLTLTYAGRPYALCSESERWRADALFAVVIAIMSGFALVTLDRFDVLDPASRAEALDWLDDLCNGEGRQLLDTVIISGTLKAKPDLGETIDVVWLPGKGQALQEVA